MNTLSNGREYMEENTMVFTLVKGSTYICCNHCGLPMDKSNVYIWKEAKDGKPFNLNLLHYKCQEPFERTHEGKWFSKGMLSVKIVW